MKKLRILACALIVACSGLFFVGCADKTFKANKINVSGLTTTYNGQEQIFSVTGYKGMNVTYSLDGKNFVNAEDLDLVNAGVKTVYYKISKKGYKDYVSSVEFIIQQKSISINIPTITGTASKTEQEIISEIESTYANVNGIVDGDTLNIVYHIDAYATDQDKTVGEEYIIIGVDDDSNYDITLSTGKYKIVE